MEKISIEAMCARKRVLIDVRSPGEFMHGHTPQALNLPLFTDEEREIVGITYKKFGKRPAIEKGLELVGFHKLVQEIRRLDLPFAVDIYCARGGMRSSSVAWLFELLGYQPALIDGGYKSYRRWVLKRLSQPYSLFVLGGETGSGKTKILKALAARGENVIDLEGLARHRGSVFGEIEQQPTQEQFENELAEQLVQKKDRAIWVENESQRIGALTIPRFIFEQMRKAPMVVLQVPEEKRVQECLDEYLSLGAEKLSIAIVRLQRRLGGLETKKALDALAQNNFQECCRVLLRYYDKKYRYGMSQRDPKSLTMLSSDTVAGDKIIDWIQKIFCVYI